VYLKSALTINFSYSVDTSGAELYTLFFLDLNTFQLYPETITETSFAWGNDNRTGFIPKLIPPTALLSSSDTLGSTPDDVLIHHEEDESFFIDVGTTRSEAYILMSLDSKVTSEIHYLDANNPNGFSGNPPTLSWSGIQS